jgi:hypothetical protein
MRTGLWIGAVAVAGLVVAWPGCPAVADEAKASPVAVTLDAAFLSAYVWRGQVLNDELVLQPAMTVTKGVFLASAWGSYNLTDRVTGEKADFSEVDVTLSAAAKFGPVAASAGLIEYVFPNQTAGGAAAQGTRELFVTLSFPDWVVVPNLGVYRDIDEVDGTYATAGLAWTAAMGDRLSLTLSGSIAYGDKDYNGIYFGVNDSAWNDANVGLSLSWKVTDAVTVVPSVQYTTLADTEVKDGAGGLYRDDSRVVGGLKVSVAL